MFAGDIVRIARARADLSQQQLADRSGVPRAPQRPGDGAVAVVAGDSVGLTGEMVDAGFAPSDDDQRWTDSDRRWTWHHPAGGTVVLASGLPGVRDHADLRRSAIEVPIGDELRLRVAHPRDLLRIADASPRESERSRAPGLRALLAHPTESR